MTAHDTGDHEAAGQQQQRRTEPQQPRLALDPRLVQHELAVARDEVVLDLRVGLALSHQREDFAPQVVRDHRVGIGQRLVLAHHAAQFGDQRAEAGLLGPSWKRSGLGSLIWH